MVLDLTVLGEGEALAIVGDALQLTGAGHVVSIVAREGGSFLDVCVQLDQTTAATRVSRPSSNGVRASI